MPFSTSQHLENKCLFFFLGFFSSKRAHSLIAPVQSYSDVTLDLTSLVLGEMTLDQLPTQVDELIHHMAQLMEQIHLVFLLSQNRFSWDT